MATSNRIRALNRLPFDFEDGLKVGGVDVTSLNQAFTPAGAGLIGFTPVGNLGSVTVQAAIAELDVEKVDNASLAASAGSSLVGYDGSTVQAVLDNAKPIADYTALRAYTGRAAQVRITTSGISGFFYYDASDTDSTDNGGTIIVSGNGKRWKRLFDGSVNVKWFGAKGNGVDDDTVAFNAAISSLSEGDTLLASGVFYIANTVNVTKNVNMEFSGKVLLASNNSAFIQFTQDYYLAVGGTALTALPKDGDSQLMWAIAPSLDYPSNYFFSLISTEEEITRIGQVYYTPYTKNESNAIITETYFLRANINLTYTDASKLTVYFYKKSRPVTIRGLNVSVVPQVGASSKNEVIKLSGSSNIVFENLVIDRLNTNWYGNNFTILNSHGLVFRNCQIKGSNSTLGDSYAFICSISSFLRFDNCEYTDGNGFTKRERGYAARHGNYISFYNCRFAGIDDHYGHNYFIENCVFNLRGVSVSGGSVTIKDSKILGSTYLYSQRPDAPYSNGTLHIENCEADSRLVLSSRDTDARSTKRKFYDHVRIVNCKVSNFTFVDAAIKIINFLPTDTLSKTSKLEISDVAHIRGLNDSYCNLYLGSLTPSEDGGTLYRWVETADFINCEMSLKNYTNTGFGSTYIPVRALNADNVRFINNRGLVTYGCNVGVSKYISCELSYGAYNFEMQFPADCGEVTFDNCDIGALINPDVSAATTRFILKNNLLTYKYLLATGGAGSRLAVRTVYMSKNRALPDADLTGAPASIEYYINSTYYKTA